LNIVVGTTVTVNGTLLLLDGSIGYHTPSSSKEKYIIAKGNVIQKSTFDDYISGDGKLILEGTGAQIYSIEGGFAPHVVFNNPNLNVTPSADCTFSDLTLSQEHIIALTLQLLYGPLMDMDCILMGGYFKADTGTLLFGSGYTPDIYAPDRYSIMLLFRKIVMCILSLVPVLL